MASTPPKPPDAFLSYTRFDDRHDGGAISEFCRRLASAVQAVTGVPFDIFQDVEGIGIGEHWPGKLDQMLDQARFFIPIITPSYFTSGPCREELEKFLRAEAARGRNDLVLPIYYIESDLLEYGELRAEDPLATMLHERQRQDWRELRFEPFGAPSVRRALEQLARKIVKARRRPIPHEPAKSNAEPTAPVALTSEKSTVLGRLTQHEIEVQDTLVLRDSTLWSRTRTLRPGTVFRDINAPWCPELVVIPPGKFTMGSTEEEGIRLAVGQGIMRDYAEAEKPRHQVRIAYSLAIGRFPVTFEEYGHFARTKGRAEPDDEGWGRGQRPVIKVSWGDARAYIDWLRAETSQPYRLLSEAEWEYACRAGTTTRYWWGNEITPENANYGKSVGRTSEVGGYPANPWGLYDMYGNVWEWVEDCWNGGYKGAPSDGSAWTSGHCDRRVLRGGSWDLESKNLRSGLRYWFGSVRRHSNVGFRIARTLTAQPAASPVKDAHWNKLEYDDPELTGRVTFNYSNNDGRYSIGLDEFFFETQWSKASDQSIYLLNDPPSIEGVAEAPELQSYKEVTDLASYDMSSRVRTIQEGEHAILKNRHGKYAVLRILDIKDRTRSDTVDAVTFDFWILNDPT